MKPAASHPSRRSRTAICAGLMLMRTVVSTASEPTQIESQAADFTPGYRFTQVYFEDGAELTSKGIELGWAAVNRRGFELDLSTGLRMTKRDLDGWVSGGWTAAMAITAPWPVAPYAELGFDAGEVLGEIIIERAVKNSKGRNWIDPDAFIGTGLRMTLTHNLQMKAYYKLHYVESEHYHAVRSGTAGIALVWRFPRQHLQWWQIPLDQ